MSSSVQSSLCMYRNLEAVELCSSGFYALLSQPFNIHKTLSALPWVSCSSKVEEEAILLECKAFLMGIAGVRCSQTVIK
jgi:hypothetical protein